MGSGVDAPLDGLVTFYSSHYALKAESALRAGGIRACLIPGPKELSPNCGVALQFPLRERPQVEQQFLLKKVRFENIFEYLAKTSTGGETP
jgi:hypothetical protein